MKDIGSVRREIKKAYKTLQNQGGWRAVGSQFGISGGMAFRIAVQDYEPADAHIRTRLGLPAIVEAPACHICGEVHLKGHPRKRKPERWFDVPASEIRQAFEEREAVDG